MSLSAAEVVKVSHLARLSIDEASIPKYAGELSKILDTFAQMNAVNTEGVPPTTHPLDLPQRLREDSVSETNQREAMQAIAPSVTAGLYLVPQVIE